MNRIPRDVRRKLDSSAAEIHPAFQTALKKQLFTGEPMARKQSSTKSFLNYVRSTPALAVLAAIVIVGTTSALVATNRANVAHQQEIEVPANLDGLLPLDDIRAIALKDAGDASITGIELEKEDEGLLYKVKFSDGSFRLYDAKTGEPVVASSDTDNDDVSVKDVANTIGLAEARRIASEQRPGATITKIELESEEGVIVYSVRFSDGGRVDVNAKTGDVVRVRGASNSGSGSSNSGSDDDDDDRRSSNSGSGSSHDDEDDDHSGSNSGSGSSHDEDEDEDEDEDDDEDDNSGSGKDDD